MDLARRTRAARESTAGTPLHPDDRVQPSLKGRAEVQDSPVALMILTRDPTGQVSGRKTVLATAAQGLESAGYRVEALVLARRPSAVRWAGRHVHHVRLPSLPRVALSAVGVLLRRRGSLNESLFDSPGVRRRAVATAREVGAVLVVADGLRTVSAAVATDLPVLLHLDDLLSDRYAMLVADASSAQQDLLGFFGEQVPAAVRPALRRVARSLLGLEARRVRARELQVVDEADVVAMTSQDEADELARRTGAPVVALPMAIGVREAGDPAAADACSFVFLGLLDYAPNLAALRWWLDEVRPCLDELGGTDIRLTVVGQSSRVLPADDRVTFTGYVDDLGRELRRHRGMVAPVLSGAGVKTKVLDGWSVGLPVVATPAGAAGLADQPGLLIGMDASAFARAVMLLHDDASAAAALGQAGREVLLRDWSEAALADRWRTALAPLKAGAAGRGRGPSVAGT